MFKYRVEYFDDIEGNVEEAGLIGAKTYEDAVKALIEYYGVPNSIKIELYADSTVLPYNDIKNFFNSLTNA